MEKLVNPLARQNSIRWYVLLIVAANELEGPRNQKKHCNQRLEFPEGAMRHLVPKWIAKMPGEETQESGGQIPQRT